MNKIRGLERLEGLRESVPEMGQEAPLSDRCRAVAADPEPDIPAMVSLVSELGDRVEKLESATLVLLEEMLNRRKRREAFRERKKRRDHDR